MCIFEIWMGVRCLWKSKKRNVGLNDNHEVANLYVEVCTPKLLTSLHSTQIQCSHFTLHLLLSRHLTSLVQSNRWTIYIWYQHYHWLFMWEETYKSKVIWASKSQFPLSVFSHKNWTTVKTTPDLGSWKTRQTLFFVECVRIFDTSNSDLSLFTPNRRKAMADENVGNGQPRFVVLHMIRDGEI